MIDFHAHIPLDRESPAGSIGPPYGPVEYVAVMDSLGIELSVMLPLEGLRRPSPAKNDGLASWVATAPTRLVAFGTVDPRLPTAAVEAERCFKELGMCGLKFHPWMQQFTCHASYMDDVACVAETYRGIVLFHDGTPPDSTPLQIATLARRHPNASFVLGHGGLQDMWREAIVAVNTTPNLYVCLCATPNIGMREAARQCPPERLLFGTDAGLGAEALQPYVAGRVQEVRTLAIPDETREAMLITNPRRLLGKD